MRHPRHEIRRKRRKLLPQKATGALIRAGDSRQRVAARPRRPRENWGEVHRAVLPNGLRVLTAGAPGLHSAMIALYVRAGSRHETAARNGVSHFLEHLFFRGSLAWPDTVAMNAAVESAGGSLNGITARDHGCYYTPIHPDEVGTGLAILGDLIRRPLLKEMDVEREVILEEILDEVDADGRDIDPDNLSKRIVFGDHPLGYKIAGTPQIVRRLARRDVRAHHQRFYTGSNLVLAVAGPVRASEVEALAEEHLGLLPRGKPSTDLAPPPWPEGPRLELVEHDDAQAEFSLSFPCPPERHPDYPVHLCIRRILDDGLSSRLPFEIVERRGLAYSLHAGIDTFADAGMTVVDGACAPRKLPRVLEEILRVLGALAEQPMPEEELLRVQRRHRMTLAFSLDSAADLAGWYGAGEVLSAPESFEDRCRRVEGVTPADVRRVAAETFRRRNLVAVVVGPSGRRERAVLSRIVSTTTAIPT
ncbi:pitrilysin family protein [Anaeromyxobacter sp. Fw109-5]|uniref:M16 family metallopeptidase n=1 Tax=Anaeromyxobacter sp. (strain Fw109-5) TaxID=404589 RepID=UPI0000ED772C|nr:pitrilysin family protein [Anaeromyxobacter sp. Fw109-5]ABS24832.1 peptidase M16 domain protein [Anaeromyxobacter sp. Fw109-5]